MVETAKLNMSEKAERLKVLTEEYERVKEIVANYANVNAGKKMEQEIEELVYYIHQRSTFRYGDFFKEVFNPSVIKGGTRKQKALIPALKELLSSIGFDLDQNYGQRPSVRKKF